MNYWLALYCPPSSAPAEAPDRALDALAGWALQFTPRVALLEEAVVLEVQASLKLFGGAQALRRRLARPARQLGCQRMAWAPTSLAALALARALEPDGFAEPLQSLLDRLPLDVLTTVAAHRPILSRLGCRTLGDVRALPRAGLNRRFGQGLLEAMDRTYGLQPESHEWIELPETFEVRVELPGRVENAAALMFASQRLLLQMGAWLTARHSGVLRFTLSWQHDFHRRSAGPGGELQVSTANATRHIDHLRRLLSEQLDRLVLAAPVGALALRVDEAQPLPEASAGLWPQQELQGDSDAAQSGRKLDELIERLGARLGAERVQRPVLHADHRAEAMQSFEPASISQIARARRRLPAPVVDAGAQPAWVLPEPLPLPTRRDKPTYRGPLELVAGPNRVEIGWWQDGSSGAAQATAAPGASTLRVQRDYYVAHGAQVGLVWIYRERQGVAEADSAAPWFLHGIFA